MPEASLSFAQNIVGFIYIILIHITQYCIMYLQQQVFGCAWGDTGTGNDGFVQFVMNPSTHKWELDVAGQALAEKPSGLLIPISLFLFLEGPPSAFWGTSNRISPAGTSSGKNIVFFRACSISHGSMSVQSREISNGLASVCQDVGQRPSCRPSICPFVSARL